MDDDEAAALAHQEELEREQYEHEHGQMDDSKEERGGDDMQFQKAQRKRAKLRLAVAGPSGSGKTTAALTIAKGLGGRVAVIDTERGSASLYSDQFEFDTLELNPPYSPERFIEAVKSAEKAGYDVLILDSITHEWNGSGGCCDINEALASAKYRGNTWSAWSETTPRHRAFLDALLQSPMHIIATMRSKTETVQGEDKKVRKIGMKTEQRDGTDYEFTVLLELDHSSHIAAATKDRTRMFRDPHIVTPETGEALLAWLNSGAEQRISDAEILSYVDAINTAQDPDALKAAFAAAYKAAKKIGHDQAAEEFTATYNKRKEALAKEAA